MPIIALTANAVTGMREIFLEKGFNDFLAKPIDVSKLDEMLIKWITKEKREEGRGKSEKKLVLIVDDNLANLRAGINALKGKYSVISAPSEEKMLNLLETNNPALILLGANITQPEPAASRDIPLIVITEPLNITDLIVSIEGVLS
jgi:CheY-like chemotaxis protein